MLGDYIGLGATFIALINGVLASGKANNDAHRPPRKGLRPRDTRNGRQRGSTRCEMEKLTARKSHGVPPVTAPRLFQMSCL